MNLLLDTFEKPDEDKNNSPDKQTKGKAKTANVTESMNLELIDSMTGDYTEVNVAIQDSKATQSPKAGVSAESHIHGGYNKTPSNKFTDINKDQELLDLINKSNQLTHQQMTKNRIYAVIIISLLISVSAIYFFIAIKASQQDIFISHKTPPMLATPDIISHISTAPIEPIKSLHGISQSTDINPHHAAPEVGRADNLNLTAPIKKTLTPHKKDKAIHIVHSKKVDPVQKTLLNAYHNFHQHNFHKSETLYLEILKLEPKNRDALLGLAAIASTQKRYEAARQKYQYLLKLNPRDFIAIAGLTSLENMTGIHVSESKLKFMIKQQPDSAHLYFAQATQYASQKKWPEAQTAYFSAWSADNKNADYAYNLAVSLDHLNQRKQALNYYQLCLKLNKGSIGNFSTAKTQARINSLLVSRQLANNQ